MSYPFVTSPVFFWVISCWHLAQISSRKTTPCPLSATAYSIYSRLPSILEVVLPTANAPFRGPHISWHVPIRYVNTFYLDIFQNFILINHNAYSRPIRSETTTLHEQMNPARCMHICLLLQQPTHSLLFRTHTTSCSILKPH